MAHALFDLLGSIPFPVFNFGQNHITGTPSGTIIDGVKYSGSVIDPAIIAHRRLPTYSQSFYADEDLPKQVTFRGPVDISTQRLTSSAAQIYGPDSAAMKWEIPKPPEPPKSSITIKACSMLVAVPSKMRKGWDLLLKKDKSRLYSDIGGGLCSSGTDTFTTVYDNVCSNYGGFLKINTKVGSFVILDELGTYFQIFICTGNIYGDLPDDMEMFPLSGMTDIEQIEKFMLPSVKYILQISPRLRMILLDALRYGRFKYLCDNQP